MSPRTLTITPLLQDLVYGEGPRWRDDKLWFADSHGNMVRTVDERGASEVILETHHPSGLGFLPDGRLLISILGPALLQRFDGKERATIQDLSEWGTSLNDMVVGPDGRAYIDLYRRTETGTRKGDIVLVDGDDARIVARDLDLPNGLAITPDGQQLIVAETWGERLTSFTIERDGSLSDRRVYAEVPDRTPDGISLDAESAVWFGSFLSSEFIRVRPGGEITDVIPVPGLRAIAPRLGGQDGKTLFVITADTDIARMRQGDSKASIGYARVDVPTAGWP